MTSSCSSQLLHLAQATNLHPRMVTMGVALNPGRLVEDIVSRNSPQPPLMDMSLLQ